MSVGTDPLMYEDGSHTVQLVLQYGLFNGTVLCLSCILIMYIDTTNSYRVIPPQREHHKMAPIDCCLFSKVDVGV